MPSYRTPLASASIPSPSLFEQLSVFKNLHIAAENRFGFADDLAHKAHADRIGFMECADVPAASLSHGQKQRSKSQWLRSLAKVDMLDEPTAGMSTDEVDRPLSLSKI